MKDRRDRRKRGTDYGWTLDVWQGRFLVRERFDNLRMDYIDKSNLIGETNVIAIA